jgi:hypothetical protein
MNNVLSKKTLGIAGFIPKASKALLLCLAAGSMAHATDIFLEAEHFDGLGGERNASITSPLLIKDDNLASDGSYIEVLGGNNSTGSMPATEGVSTLVFDQPDASAQFTIWARVIAPSTADDSFWLKMDGGSPINWNNIPQGTAWHWVQIKADGAASAAKFTLSQGSHTLKIAFREDGTKLDQFIITSNASFNPNAALTGAPLAPKLVNNYEGSSAAGTLLSWNVVPGATSYKLVKVTSAGETVVTTGTGHTRVIPLNSGDYYVVAIAPNGAQSAPGSLSLGSYGNDRFYDAYLNAGTVMTTTPPMASVVGNFGPVYITNGTSPSLNAVPAHGRARYDFRLANTTDFNIYAEVQAPSTNSDSYWVRVDQGAWVKWNSIPDYTCSPVRNSDAGNAVVNYHLNAGSHFVEFAYREVGIELVRLGLATYFQNVSPCED